MKDIIVDEIHEVRRDMMKRFQNDLKKLCCHIKECEQKNKARVAKRKVVRLPKAA